MYLSDDTSIPDNKLRLDLSLNVNTTLALIDDFLKDEEPKDALPYVEFDFYVNLTAAQNHDLLVAIGPQAKQQYKKTVTLNKKGITDEPDFLSINCNALNCVVLDIYTDAPLHINQNYPRCMPYLYFLATSDDYEQFYNQHLLDARQEHIYSINSWHDYIDGSMPKRQNPYIWIKVFKELYNQHQYFEQTYPGVSPFVIARQVNIPMK